MAKQAGPFKLKGGIGGICFYKLDGVYYARARSTLSRERVKSSAAFKETMRHADLLARGSVLGATVYRLLPTDERGRKVYQQITGKAMTMLKNGLTENEVLKKLKEEEFI